MFETLNKIDVSKKIEKKGNLSYLSWAWAWQELKKVCPDAYYTVYENSDGWIYHTDNRTAWVKTGVTTVADDGHEQEYIEYLPVMDYRNKSIPLDQLTSMNVNTAIQRSLTKAIARHGLGLYIYAGEDLPDIPKELPKDPKHYIFIGGKFRSRTIEDVVDELGVDSVYGYRDWMQQQDKISVAMQGAIDQINKYEGCYGK